MVVLTADNVSRGSCDPQALYTYEQEYKSYLTVNNGSYFLCEFGWKSIGNLLMMNNVDLGH
jgi:hypothetical protein